MEVLIHETIKRTWDFWDLLKDPCFKEFTSTITNILHTEKLSGLTLWLFQAKSKREIEIV